jgi:signal peptidase I
MGVVMKPEISNLFGLPEKVIESALDLWAQAKKEHEVPIRGGSMFPILKEGDVARVIHGGENHEPGDIVVFRKDWGLIAHRVLLHFEDDSGSRFYITQGDRCRFPDPPVKEGEIIGRVVGVLRAGRFLTFEQCQQKWLNRLATVRFVLKARLRRWKWIFQFLKSGNGI